MTINSWLKETRYQLESYGIGTADLDSLILLEDALGKNRAWILAHQDEEIPDSKLINLTKQIAQRTQHIPLAFVRGKTEFYGRVFTVDSRVLEPRPESETMLELLFKLPLSDAVSLADIGTGSGALGLTAKLEHPTWDVTLTDIDSDSLDVARINAQLHNATVTILQGDLLSQAAIYFDVLLCNLPYVPDKFTINSAAMHEPRHAIFGGTDGLDLYRKLFEQVNGLTGPKPEYILTESLPPQHEKLTRVAEKHGYKRRANQDFILVFASH